MEVDNDGHSVPATVDYRIHPYGAGPIVRWNWKNTSTRAVTMMHSQMIQVNLLRSCWLMVEAC